MRHARCLPLRDSKPWLNISTFWDPFLSEPLHSVDAATSWESPAVKREAEEEWGEQERSVTERAPPERADLVDDVYAPFTRPLGNLVVLFAQAEAEWLH